MKRKLEKVPGGLLLAVLLFAGSSFEPNAALAGTRRRDKAQARETIAKFLSSIRLVKKAYHFDHNGDGVIDMSVYPLKTENPDLKTKFVTLAEAISKKQLILRENPGLSDIREQPPSSYSIFAQYLGSRPLYYPRGGQIRGGWQNRGFRRGGILGSGYGYRDFGQRRYYDPYGPSRRRYNRRYPGYYRFGNFSGISLEYSDSGRFSPAGIFGSKHNTDSSQAPEKPGVEVDALCFEKWRPIEESRRLGEPEYFSYAGMASPYVRRELIIFPSQTKVHTAIDMELSRLGVQSKTRALADAFKDRRIKEVIDYYIANSKKVLKENKGISGMIVTSGNRILCADIYASGDLFKKMFSQLMQSAALGVCQRRKKSRKYSGRSDVEKFLQDLKGIEKLKKQTPQTYRLCSAALVSEAMLYFDKKETRLVHIEAYPRR